MPRPPALPGRLDGRRAALLAVAFAGLGVLAWRVPWLGWLLGAVLALAFLRGVAAVRAARALAADPEQPGGQAK